MVEQERYEFGSAEWRAAYRKVVDDLFEGIVVEGRVLTMGEVFTDAPARLIPDGDDVLAWYLLVDERGVRAVDGRPKDPDVEITVDYARARDAARVVYGDGPEGAARAMQARAAAQEGGSAGTVGDLSAVPPAMFGPLLELHDAMAERTA